VYAGFTDIRSSVAPTKAVMTVQYGFNQYNEYLEPGVRFSFFFLGGNSGMRCGLSTRVSCLDLIELKFRGVGTPNP
jgi:hypothetical protein